VAIKTLFDALKECLKDGHKASFYEAKVVREIILADGQVSSQERILLEEALHKDKFDDKAVSLLSKLLLRADCSAIEENKEDKGHCC
jgi:hypothetical protein